MEISLYALPSLGKQRIEIQGIQPADTRPLQERIIDVICKEKSVTLRQLQSPTRKMEVTYARQLAMTIINAKTKLSLRSIGELFGRHHTTVISAKKTIQDWYDTDAGKRWEYHFFLNYKY